MVITRKRIVLASKHWIHKDTWNLKSFFLAVTLFAFERRCITNLDDFFRTPLPPYIGIVDEVVQRILRHLATHSFLIDKELQLQWGVMSRFNSTAVPYLKATTKVEWGWKQGVAGLKVCKYERLICLLNTISTNISGHVKTVNSQGIRNVLFLRRQSFQDFGGLWLSEPSDLPNVT